VVARQPVDLIGDAPPQRFRDATAALLADPGVDALLRCTRRSP
jgi:acyl-CoA synthetase (NDP forming)